MLFSTLLTWTPCFLVGASWSSWFREGIDGQLTCLCFFFNLQKPLLCHWPSHVSQISQTDYSIDNKFQMFCSIHMANADPDSFENCSLYLFFSFFLQLVSWVMILQRVSDPQAPSVLIPACAISVVQGERPIFCLKNQVFMWAGEFPEGCLMIFLWVSSCHLLFGRGLTQHGGQNWFQWPLTKKSVSSISSLGNYLK